MWLRAVLAALLVAVGGCSDPETSPAPVPPVACEAGASTAEDGSCQPAGLGPEDCGPGFVHDGDRGCDPILPPTACGPGLMAVPGDAECREVAPCDDGTWGSIPIEPSTAHVDAAYTGGANDGTATRPWTTIQAGIDAASPGAIVAVAPGIYIESLLVQDKAVRIWGRCPGLVELRSASATLPALAFRGGISDASVEAIAITGPGDGLEAIGFGAMRATRLWLHDLGGRGLDSVDSGGVLSITLEDSLVERATESGFVVGGANLQLLRSVIRDTQPDASGDLGHAVDGLPNPASDSGASLTVTGCLIERNHDIGINFSGGSELAVDSTVVRDTLPNAATGANGMGIVARSDTSYPVALAEVRRSLIERSRWAGVMSINASLTVDATVVRDTMAEESSGEFGRGIEVQHEPLYVGSCALDVARSLVTLATETGLSVGGCPARVHRTVIRDTRSSPDGTFGYGVTVVSQPAATLSSSLEMTDSVVERNVGAGIHVSESTAIIEHTRVSDVAQVMGAIGRGINAQDDGSASPSHLVLRGVRVDHVHEFGVLVINSEGELDDVIVAATSSRADGLYGDGIAAWAFGAPARLTATATQVDASARAGISSFGAEVALRDTVLRCNRIDLAGQSFDAFMASLSDDGGNVCGCDTDDPCKLSDADLEPPLPLDSE